MKWIPKQFAFGRLYRAPRRPLSRGFSPSGYLSKPLVSYQINRQVSGWIPPPLVIRAFGRTAKSRHSVRWLCLGKFPRAVGNFLLWRFPHQGEGHRAGEQVADRAEPDAGADRKGDIDGDRDARREHASRAIDRPEPGRRPRVERINKCHAGGKAESHE